MFIQKELLGVALLIRVFLLGQKHTCGGNGLTGYNVRGSCNWVVGKGEMIFR